MTWPKLTCSSSVYIFKGLLILLGQFQFNFICSLLALWGGGGGGGGGGGIKFMYLVEVTWPGWPPCAYMVKTVHNLLFHKH